MADQKANVVVRTDCKPTSQSETDDKGLVALEHPYLLSPALTASAEGIDEYTVVGPNCDHHAGKKDQLQTVVFEVPKNRYILYLTQDCVGGPCGWSYNPDGGYDLWVRYFEGRTKAEWRRWHTSLPVTYKIRVHWASLA
ncbi:MAG: hypothetical protein AMXMBFR56_37160 [Polyangiaceae bacterium]